MSTDKPPTIPTTMDDIDVTNARRVTLTRSGVAALFAQSSFDTGEKISAASLTRPVREYRPPSVVRSRVVPTSTTSTNANRTTGLSAVAAQRTSLFRYVVQRSSSFATTAVSHVMSNTNRRPILKQIRSICNQHDKVSSVDIDVEPVASITDCLEAPSIAAVQICRSISMPNAASKYRQHYEQKHILVKNAGKPI